MCRVRACDFGLVPAGLQNEAHLQLWYTEAFPLLLAPSQGSVLAPLLFNTYISDLPTTVSRKYTYADDLAIMHADGD